MELTTKVDQHKHITLWVKLWNGGLELTEKEQRFLGEILFRVMDLRGKGIKEPYLGELVFSTKTLAEIKKKLELSKQGLNNYKAQLKKKGVIYKDEDGIYHLDQKLIPQETLTFKFIYDGKE